MTFKEVVEQVISLPGYFVVFDSEGSDAPKPDEAPATRQRHFDMFKDKEKAKLVFEVYSKSKANSIALLNEAGLLLDNHSYARAVALAIMSYEELGKSQIAADYYSGLLPESEYDKSFKRHEKTAYASRYRSIGTHEKVKHGFYIDKDVAKVLEQIRQAALYVDEDNNPSDNFTRDDAELIIAKVNEHHESISHAEWLNCRIGSKALFK